MGCKANATKRLQLSRTTSTSTNVDNMLENGRTKISYKNHQSHIRTSFEKHAHLCMLTMFVTHENKNQCTRETKSPFNTSKGKNTDRKFVSASSGSPSQIRSILGQNPGVHRRKLSRSTACMNLRILNGKAYSRKPEGPGTAIFRHRGQEQIDGSPRWQP